MREILTLIKKIRKSVYAGETAEYTLGLLDALRAVVVEKSKE